jgi:hypothetical protein
MSYSNIFFFRSAATTKKTAHNCRQLNNSYKL